MGEFGYELSFQSWVQALRPHYTRVYVITYPGRKILYPGCEVVTHEVPLEKAGYGVTGRHSPRTHRTMARELLPHLSPSTYDLFFPQLGKSPVLRSLIWAAKEKPISAPFRFEDRTDLLLHFRSVQKDGWDKRPNFEGAHADALWRACAQLGLKTACIGHPCYAYCPAGCADFRNEDLAETVAKICATRLVVGQQSGGVHLANYCAKPTLTWAATPKIIAAGLRLNPHGVPINVVTDASWLPPVEAIIAKLKELLPSLQPR
jgi:hypothetical protein